jgi:hypothetical protein
MPQP